MEREPSLSERDMAVSRLRVLEGYLGAAARRAEVLEAVASTSTREQAAILVAEVLGVNPDVADAVLDLRLVRFTGKELDQIREERDALVRRETE